MLVTLIYPNVIKDKLLFIINIFRKEAYLCPVMITWNEKKIGLLNEFSDKIEVTDLQYK